MDDFDEVLDYYYPTNRHNLFNSLKLGGLVAALAMLVKTARSSMSIKTRKWKTGRSPDTREDTPGPPFP